MSKEILMVVESVSLEKGVPEDVIIDALEQALAMATKKRYQDHAEFRVSINRETGNHSTFRCWKVSETESGKPAQWMPPTLIAISRPLRLGTMTMR